MKIIVLGGDGFCGWPTALHLSARGHDVIIGRRHYVDGAENDSQLAGSGTLTPEEHFGFITFTIDALADLLDAEADRMGSRGGAFTARAFATEIRNALEGETA